MSAQPAAQIGGTPSKSPLLQRLRGSFSVSTQQVSQPLPASAAPAPPITLEQVAAEVTEEATQAAEIDQAPPPEAAAPLPEEQTPDVLSSELVPDAAAQAVPMAVTSMTDTLNPPDVVGGGTAKETPLLSVTVEHPAVDQAGGVQYVETEKSHELPPEVEGFIKKVEDNVDQIPEEIVIADQQTGQSLPRVLAQPVVVLPITSKMEEEGKKKPPTYSIRWLIEWSWKMMKRFSGKVVYREEEAAA
ncbi:hypothetical protein H3C70_04940 [Patescibacteria group bacterium]|nr:hypothetical protein [Patescibacteria group bacterium]